MPCSPVISKISEKLITGWVRITVTADCYVLAFTSAVAGLQIVEKTITSRIVIDPNDLQSPIRLRQELGVAMVVLWLMLGHGNNGQWLSCSGRAFHATSRLKDTTDRTQ